MNNEEITTDTQSRIDELEARVKELEVVVQESNEYLNTNEYTTIGHGSTLHKKIQYLDMTRESL